MEHYTFVDPYPVDGFKRVLNEKGLWGMINPKGKEIIPCEFTYLSVPYPTGNVLASKGSLDDFINKPIVIKVF